VTGGAAMGCLSLTEVVEDLLDAAGSAANGRSARTIHGGSDQALRQTVIALVRDHALGEHESPGEATLQVLRGRVRLSSGEDSVECGVGDHVVIPDARHDVAALEDAALLLTVVVDPG
jgi:quercetin dioxygenase-like cupin family protein